MSNIIITGRLISGHPMEARAVVDDITKQPKMQKDGVTPAMVRTLGIAIPKGAEGANWSNTDWGAEIHAAAVAGYSNGEPQNPAFSWKIMDGDSTIPNREQNRPCDREGAPGHWVLWCSTGIPIDCFHAGNYDVKIMDKGEIKTGDYCRVIVSPVANNVNGPVKTAGVYLNPAGFELIRAGQLIASSSVDCKAAFGAAGAAVLPAGALVDTAVAGPGVLANPGHAAPGAQAEPHHAFLNNAPGPSAPGPTAPPPVENFAYNGAVYTRAQLIESKWTDEQINALPRA